MKWQIGCSGFSYADWSGIFYPTDLHPQEWFEYYTTYFNTVELNVTFYRFPTPSLLKNLYTRSPQDYCFVVKAPKEITHTQQFTNVSARLMEFYKVVRNGLQEKLGAVLFPLPPSFHYNPENLQKLLESLDRNFVNVIEFRHRSWWQPEIIAALTAAGITFCGVSYPGLPDEVIINSSTPYYRFHGVPKLYYSMYKEETLLQVKNKLEAAQPAQAFLLFNNTATRAALENAAFLQDVIINL